MEKEIRMMTMKPEARSDDGDGKKMIVEGYAALFNSRTLLWESPYSGYKYFEEIASGAFDGADMTRTVFKYNHNSSALTLARTTNQTLELTTDKKGLKIRAEIADTTSGRDIYTLIKRGDLDKMSFAFTVSKTTSEDDEKAKEFVRTIQQFDEIFDVSVVDFPAYDDTSIGVAEARNNDAEFFKRLDAQRVAERRRRLWLLSMC